MEAVQGMLDWWVAVELMGWMGIVGVERGGGLDKLVEDSRVGIIKVNEVVGVRD